MTFWHLIFSDGYRGATLQLLQFIGIEFLKNVDMCHGFVSAGDALGREHPATPM